MRIRPLAAILIAVAIAAIARPAPEKSTADPLVGVWVGTVRAPQGTVAEIGFAFVTAASGSLGFRLHFPAMFTYDAPLGAEVKAVGLGEYSIPAFATRLRLQGDRLTGTFTAADLPLKLTRVDRFSAPPRPPRHPAPPPPAWRYALGAGTWAPPVTADDVVYVGTSDGRFHAVRADTGAALWVWPGPTPIDGRATVGEDCVYFLDTGFNLVALERATGALRWRQPLHDEFLAGGSPPDNPTFNHRAAAPLLHDGVLYVGSGDGGVYAVNAVTGAVLWRHAAQAPVYGSIGLHDGDTLLFGTMDGSVVLLDRHTQRETLRVRTGGGVVSTPVIAAGRLVAGSRDYLIHAFDPVTGKPAWKFSYWFSWVESTPAVRDGLLYFGGSDYARVTALDPASGRARWSTVVQGMTWGTPLVTDRGVFAGTVNQNLPGTLIHHRAGLMKLDRETGRVLWHLVLPDAPAGRFAGYAGGPALAAGRVVVAGLDGELVAYPAE